jgi:transcription elongation GreA/GreB family factor
MNSPFLSEADLARLETIHDLTAPPPRPSHEQRLELAELIASASATSDPSVLNQRVGFGDDVILLSPSDETDDFRLQVVMPHDADPTEGRISALAPVSLAILGKEKGHIVDWEANGITRSMRIAEVSKQPDTDLAPLST